MAFGDPVPEIGAEQEADLPSELQDWSRFGMPAQKEPPPSESKPVPQVPTSGASSWMLSALQEMQQAGLPMHPEPGTD